MFAAVMRRLAATVISDGRRARLDEIWIFVCPLFVSITYVSRDASKIDRIAALRFIVPMPLEWHHRDLPSMLSQL
jgi:hypothetical protein